MKQIKQTYAVKAPIEKVWRALIDPKKIEEWGAGPAKMSEKVGDKFSIWGGDIYGTNTKVMSEKQLSQDWYGGDWEKPSKVTIELTKDGDSTRINLLHTDLPEDKMEGFAIGWRDYYFEPLKKYLEN